MGENYRVLVVDDDSIHARAVKEFLRISGTFSVDMVPDIQGMWKRLDLNTYDIILLDYKLPDGTGLEALTQINGRGYQVAVVMVTAQGDERIAVQAIQQGATDYLVKSGDYMLTLPALISKTVHAYQLKLSVQHSLGQIRYQANLLNNVRDSIVVWDMHGRITYWNPAAANLFGWNSKERLGCNVAEVYLPAFRPPIIPPKPGNTIGHHVERQVQTRDQRTLWVSSRISALYDSQAGNRLIGYMDVTHDITSRKKMEAQIQAAQTHLVQAARLATIGEMASGIAHQINNPLTTIIAEAQLLTRNFPAGQPGRDSVKAIEQAGWRLQEAVQRLLEFSHPPTGPLGIVSVNQSIQRALFLVGASIQAEGVGLEIDLAEELPRVLGNLRQLEDLWVNLLLLARDAAKDESPHTIQVKSWVGSQGEVYVDVRDNGVPIPSDQLGSIFEPNFIGPIGGRGTGLELSICREIVRQHGGQITAESSPDHDTIFRVMLPSKTVNSRD